MPNTTTAIHAENLVKTFNDFRAVDDLSFEVQRGEIFALIGPNGAGKSTTIRMILDIIKPDSGSIDVLGGPLKESTKDQIGYLPEERGLYKNVKVIDLLTYLGELKSMPRQDARQRAAQLLERLDLGDHLTSKVNELSKGMAQKVQVIATLLHRPALIIIDEPFSGLDPVNTQLLKDMLYETMQQEGTAVVMSTHQMLQLQAMAGRMLMIAKGQRVLYGAVDDIRQQYAKNAVIVSGEGDWPNLPGIAQAEPHQDGTYLLTLAEGTTPDDIMERIARGDYRLRRFEVAIPSLEEIFIRVVGGEQYEHITPRDARTPAPLEA
ncbi:MAG: ABC transporter ATP-binding protein [Anaerolineales bacterium]